MKLTKEQLRKIIKEELGKIKEKIELPSEPGPASDELSVEQAIEKIRMNLPGYLDCNYKKLEQHLESGSWKHGLSYDNEMAYGDMIVADIQAQIDKCREAKIAQVKMAETKKRRTRKK
tara:strand:+ start:199 stop:552 length:354 start_codon:yes stop_codon:yes gene_type:complete